MRFSIRVSFIVATMCAAAATTVIATPTLPPLLVTGTPCPIASLRLYKWVLFEDLNAGGGYDHVVAGEYDGTIRTRVWNSAGDPLDVTSRDMVIGALPTGAVVTTRPSLSYNQLPNGRFAWIVEERRADGVVVCTYERGVDMVLHAACHL